MKQETHGLFIHAMAEVTDAVQNSVFRAYKGLSTTVLFSAVRGVHVYNRIPCKGEYFNDSELRYYFSNCNCKNVANDSKLFYETF